jgi:hypothetical protein
MRNPTIARQLQRSLGGTVASHSLPPEQRAAHRANNRTETSRRDCDLRTGKRVIGPRKADEGDKPDGADNRTDAGGTHTTPKHRTRKPKEHARQCAEDEIA